MRRRKMWLLLGGLSMLLCAAFSPPRSTWTKDELRQANTGAQVSYLSDQEQEVLTYMNLARMCPKKYLALEVRQEGLESYYKKGGYFSSLVRTLSKMKPRAALQPDKHMTDLAKCHCKELARNERLGHKRKRCPDGYMAECIAYGDDSGKRYVLRLLIDRNVRSLGHRKIVLDLDERGYKRAGVGVHKQSGAPSCVIDFE